jgi:integrase
VWRAVKTRTRRLHKNLLAKLTKADPVLQRLPLDMGIIEFITREKRRANWRWSTTLTYAASLQGALAQLGVYIPGADSIHLSESVNYRSFMKTLGHKTNQSEQRAPKPATLDDIKASIRVTQDVHTKGLLALAWPLCGRMTDVLKLQKTDVQIMGNTITVTYRRGKTIKKRGPYTVSTKAPPMLIAAIQKVLEMTEAHAFIWPAPSQHEQMIMLEKARIALRTADPELELRSIRRGALHALAAAGVEEETLMLYSGHTAVRTLRRYLNWGRKSKAMLEATEEAAEMALLA